MGNDKLLSTDFAIGSELTFTEKKQKYVSANASTFGFDSYLDTARGKEKNNNVTQSMQTNKNNAKANQKRQDVNQYERNNEPVRNETGQSDSAKQVDQKKQDKVSNTENIQSDKKNDEESAIKKVAEILGEPYENVAEVLKRLNMNVFDLLNNENLMNFLMESLAVSDVSELLGVSNIKELYIQMHAALDEMSTQVNVNYSDNLNGVADVQIDESLIGISDMTANNGLPESMSEMNQGFIMQEISNANQGANSEKQAELNISTKSGILDEMLSGSDIEGIFENIITTSDGPGDGSNLHVDGNTFRDQGQEFSNPNQDNIDMSDMINQQGNMQLNNNNSAIFREIQSKSLSAQTSNIDAQDIMNQITDRIKVDVRANLSEIRLTLRPESLGEVSLKIALENGILTAQFTAENQRVKALIESNFNQLKDALQQQGLDVAELYVSVGQDDNQGRMDLYDMNRRKNTERIRQIMGIIDEDEQPETVIGDSVVDVMA